MHPVVIGLHKIGLAFSTLYITVFFMYTLMQTPAGYNCRFHHISLHLETSNQLRYTVITGSQTGHPRGQGAQFW